MEGAVVGERGGGRGEEQVGTADAVARLSPLTG